MKYYLSLVIMILLLSSCGFNAEISNIELFANSQVITSDSLKGTQVGNVIISDNLCINQEFSLVDNYNGLFEVDQNGNIELSKNNPPVGSYPLTVIGNCDTRSQKITLEILIESIFTPMVSTWRVGTVGFGDEDNTITLPLRAGFDYDFIATWGDGTSSHITSFNDPDINHTYLAGGDYTVSLDGLLEAWYFNNAGDRDKIIAISELGSTGWKSFESAFFGCSNLTIVEGGDTSQVTNMSGMFLGATNVTPNTSLWDTSSVTTMASMFNTTNTANPDTSSWDTSSVINMAGMFFRAMSATPDTSAWNTSSVFDMSSMFFDAPLANPDTSSWDTSSVARMASMFNNAVAANPDVSSWNTSSLERTGFMFVGATSANPDMGSWDFSSIVNTNTMLLGMPSFSNLNYSRFLVALNNTNPTANLLVGFVSAAFQPFAASAHNNLTNVNSWIFTDEGPE